LKIKINNLNKFITKEKKIFFKDRGGFYRPYRPLILIERRW